jgi:hypothetical protein
VAKQTLHLKEIGLAASVWLIVTGVVWGVGRRWSDLFYMVTYYIVGDGPPIVLWYYSSLLCFYLWLVTERDKPFAHPEAYQQELA